MLTQTDLFISGAEGYNTFRIPAAVVSRQGTVLVFCEGRKHSFKDSGDIDLLLKRSFDLGRTWQPTQIVVPGGGHVSGNPAPLVDQRTGIIWLLFCKNLADGGEDLIIEGKASRTVWITSSADDGATWAQPREITSSVKKPTWTWYATGPCHGIQLRTGRLVIPCDHIAGAHPLGGQPHAHFFAEHGYAHVITSDDHGATWQIGGVAQQGTNECAVVQTATDSIYLNARNFQGAQRRAFAWSHDDGNSFAQTGWDETLIEPCCQASVIRYTMSTTHHRNRVLFSNPTGPQRYRMTVRLSYDECQSWSAGKLLNEGRSGYSDLCVLPDLSVGCFYERGIQSTYESIAFAHFDLDWLTDGQDAL